MQRFLEKWPGFILHERHRTVLDYVQHSLVQIVHDDALADRGERQSQWQTDVPGAAGKGIGCQFEGENGSLVCDYGSRILFLDGEELTDLPDVPQSIPRSGHHQRNFIQCVRSRELTESNLEYVREMTIPMHLGCISFRLGRPLKWDSSTETFVGDDAANSLLSRPYRAPWHLPS